MADAEWCLLRNLCVSLGVRDQPHVGEPGRRVDIETPRRICDKRCPRDPGLDAGVNHPADPDCLTRALAEFAIGPVRATKPESDAANKTTLLTMACLEFYSDMVVAMATRQQHLSNLAEQSSGHVLRQNLILAYPKKQRLYSEDDIHWKLNCTCSTDW